MTPTAELTARRWLVRAEGTALLFAVGATIIVFCLAMVNAGWAGGRSSLLGAGDVVVFFALGVWFDAWAAKDAQVTGIALIMAGYAVRIAALSATAMLLAKWVSQPTWFAIGASVVTLMWLVGLVVGHLRGRWPIYDLAGGQA